MLQVFVPLLCVIFLLGKGDCLVFLQGTASVKLPHDFPVGVTFYRLQALDEKTGELQSDLIEFRIIKSVIFPNGVKSGRWLFSVDEHTGSVMLAPHRRHSIAEHIGSTFALDVVAVPSSSPLQKPAHATIVVSVSEDNSTEPACQPREELCFASPEIQFQLPETLPKGSILGSMKPIPYTKLCPNAVTRYIIPSKSILGVSSKSGTLAIKSSLDYEEAISHVWNISCKVESDGDTGTFYAKVHVFVIDIDDNPPYLQNSTSTVQEIDVSAITPGKALPLQLTVLDPDSASVNDIAVSISDPLKLFYLRDPVVFHGVNGTHMLINAALVPKPRFHFPGSSYNVSVTFNDTNLINHDEDSYIEFQVVIYNRSNPVPKSPLTPDDFQVVATIFRHSTHHARVVQPMEVQSHEGYFFRLLGDRGKGLPSYRIFGVTPITGIIYVADEVALSRSTVTLYQLVLSWRSREATDRQCIVLIRVVDTGDQRSVCGLETGHHFPTCASHGNAKSCVSSCGRGSTDGFCKWRRASSRNLVSQYATCSPHLKTCPDGICDELEMLDPFLCPQDCVENVRGAAIPNDSGKGIGKAAAPCTCPSLNTCNCVHFYPAHIEKKLNLIVKSINTIPPDAHSVRTWPVGDKANFSECEGGCQLMIGFVSLIVSMLVSVAGVHIYRRYKRKSKCDEYPTITTPLYPSTQSNGSSLQDSCQQFQNTMGNRLEFPRDKLILEDILGEGEFGKVVKGQARGIAGNPELTTVAVKMLKDGSSAIEKRDLISELNLLKEIHHPNVIRLLGACTDEEGPLYLIMEYAEHGALLTYLRKTRARYPEVQLDLDELLSFALQIAKGMEYLSNMKVIHRDLAARNILVASGKVLKISDFGLSRDIYEGDKYHKSSKSRVPVKWMALESLQNNLYTTKSDVWSYGILLWEIMTVGGSPYPGIAAEKLYQMLKDGYRMPKPDDCPSYIYKIMKSCWREKPNERPTFKELVYRIESIQCDLRTKDPAPSNEEEHVGFIMTRKNKSENGCKMQQLTSFPKMSIVQIAPYEKQCLLSPTEFSV